MNDKQLKKQPKHSDGENEIQVMANGQKRTIKPPKYGYVKLVFHDGKLKSTEESEQTRYN